MKKYTITYVLMVIPAVVIGMDNSSSNMVQVKKMEIVRRIFRQQRNTVEMSLESSSQTDDEMSCSGSLSCSRSSSGSFSIPILKQEMQEKSSNHIRSKHGYTPRQRGSSKYLQELVAEQEKQEKELPFLTFDLFLMYFEEC